jgi:hypothetical protein
MGGTTERHMIIAAMNITTANGMAVGIMANVMATLVETSTGSAGTIITSISIAAHIGGGTAPTGTATTGIAGTRTDIDCIALMRQWASTA